MSRIRELIAAGKIDLLEELYEAAQELADYWETAYDEEIWEIAEEEGYPALLVTTANLCEAELSQYRQIQRYLAEDKPAAELRQANGLPKYDM